MKLREDKLIVILHLLFFTSCSARVYPFSLDSNSLCRSDENILSRRLEDDDVIKIYGKIDRSNAFRECVIKLAPSAAAKKTTTAIKFETYHINDCGTYLIVQQSPYQIFDKEVTTMFNFSCHNNPGKKVFYSEEGNSIKILLHKGRRHRDYNFLFNVTLTDHKISTGMSSAVIIATGVLVAIAIPGIGCIIYRYMKIKNWSKRQCEMEEYSTQSVHRLTSQDSSYTPTSQRYSSMPVGEVDSSSHVCVVGSHGADGRCTVCNRSHEDFAHVVDFINDRPAPNDRSSSHPHRNREDYAHVAEVGPIPHSAPLIANTCSVNIHTGSQEHRNQAPSGYGSGVRGDNAWLNVDDIEDIDDIDLSGNDLIPPSYDLVPPSYEEAVGMPKPQTEVLNPAPEVRSQLTEETDPLYQNVESLTTDVR